MDNVWTQLVRYKLAEDKLNELKKRIWEVMPHDDDIKISLEEAELDLQEVKTLIKINGEVKRMD